MARQTLPADGQEPYGDLLRNAINSAQDTADSALANQAKANVVRKTGSFTISSDLSGVVTEVDGGAVGTIPTGLPEGFVGEFSQVTGSTPFSLAAASGVTTRVGTGAGLKTNGQWSSIFLRKRSSSVSGGLPTTNLALRYNADDIVGTGSTLISAWPESSGNNHPAATQSDSTKQPTLVTNSLNGHKGVSFNSTTSCLQLTGTALNVARNVGALSVFVVYAYPSALQGARTLFGLSTNETTPRARVLLQQREQSAGNNAAGGRRNDTDASQFITGTSDAAGTVNVLTGTYNWPNTTIGLYKNGTQLAQKTDWLSAGNTANTASSAGYIGCTVSGTAEFFGGRIYEILVYADDNTSLKTNVHSYIQNTYGILVSDYAGLADEHVVLNGVA